MSNIVKVVKESLTIKNILIATGLLGIGGYSIYKMSKMEKEQKKKAEEKKKKDADFEKRKREFISANKLAESIMSDSMKNDSIKNTEERILAYDILKRDLDDILYATNENSFEDAKVQLDLDSLVFRSRNKDDISALIWKERKRTSDKEKAAEQRRKDLELEREYKIQMNQCELIRKENDKDRLNTLEQVKLITDAIKVASEGSKSPNTININNDSKKE